MEGSESRKIWVMAIEMMKIANANGEKCNNRNAETDNKSIARRFIWNPGSNPLKIPIKTPREIAKRISNIFYFLQQKSSQSLQKRTLQE